MKSLNLLVLAAALFIALPASAQQVKPYHQNIKDCAACHTKENAVAGQSVCHARQQSLLDLPSKLCSCRRKNQEPEER